MSAAFGGPAAAASALPVGHSNSDSSPQLFKLFLLFAAMFINSCLLSWKRKVSLFHNLSAAGLHQAPGPFGDFITVTGQAARGKEQASCALSSQHLQMFAGGPSQK